MGQRQNLRTVAVSLENHSIYFLKREISFMKNRTLMRIAQLFGFIVLIAVIGFSFGACRDGSGHGGSQRTAPKITTALLTGGTVGTAYSQTIDATGDKPITWSHESGKLPAGLSLAETTGIISGTPTAAGTSTFTVKATNAAGSKKKQLTITIVGNGGGQGTAPTITTASLPDGTVGTAYNQTLTATGDKPVTWSLESGALQEDLSLAANGAISGTPTAAGTFNFTVKAANAAGNGTKQFSITIATAGGGGTAPTITTASLPNGTVGTAYNQTLTATGDKPITWSENGGTLPSGLSLAATGAIAGTPTAAGTSNFTVKATNAAGNVTNLLTITIADSGGNQPFIEMVPIQGGTFTMGSPTTEANRYADEAPHSVTLTGFYMSKYQVTQAQYEEVTGDNPSYFTEPVSPETSTANRPVECVTWFDAVEFCNKLSTKEKLTPVYTITRREPATGYPITDATVTANWNANGYRLPTEAQWEYACRAETTTAYNTGATINSNTGWYTNNSGDRTHTVGGKPANRWGLYDMHGNVYEWCWDWYSSTYYSSSPAQNPTGPASGDSRVPRGGSFVSSGQYLRSAYRDYFDPSDMSGDIGFRIVRPE
jgi:formylglycine-generating enzyme required for sulfatase activity